MEESYKYWAFISYSHADEEQAAWLHRALETYRVPRQLVGRQSPDTTLPKRLFPIFRDREELAGASDLSGKIKEALLQSRYLIVVCSPQAAASKWVGEEIRTFKSLGRQDRVLSLIVAGEPNASETPGKESLECFPPPLRFGLNAQGVLTSERAEPLAADVRDHKDGRAAAKLKVLAGLLNVGYDELRRRDLQRTHQRRVLTTIGAISFASVMAVAYILMADAGARVIGQQAIQSFVDSRDMSVFRHASTLDEIGDAATQARLVLLRRLEEDANGTIAALQAGHRIGKWMRDLTEREQQEQKVMAALSVWDSSQALYSMLSAPEGKAEHLRKYLPVLEETFDDDVLIPGYGWRQYRMEYTRAEPALWTAAMLAVVLKKEGLLTSAEHNVYRNRLAQTQAIALTYRPTTTGGWNLFPNQSNINEPSTYATMLALLALLETKSAGLTWAGSKTGVDELIRSSADWLVEQFESKSSPPGWRPAPDDREGTISDGLTLQTYTVLLRLEKEMGYKIPAAIARAMSDHVEILVERTAAHPTSNNRFNRAFKNHQGKNIDVRPSTNYLWYPWAISCTAQWLKRSERVGETTEARVRIRRSLGHLVVDLGQNGDLVKQALKSTGSYTAAETLYGLSFIERAFAGIPQTK